MRNRRQTPRESTWFVNKASQAFRWAIRLDDKSVLFLTAGLKTLGVGTRSKSGCQWELGEGKSMPANPLSWPRACHLLLVAAGLQSSLRLWMNYSLGHSETGCGTGASCPETNLKSLENIAVQGDGWRFTAQKLFSCLLWRTERHPFSEPCLRGEIFFQSC